MSDDELPPDEQSRLEHYRRQADAAKREHLERWLRIQNELRELAALAMRAHFFDQIQRPDLIRPPIDPGLLRRALETGAFTTRRPVEIPGSGEQLRFELQDNVRKLVLRKAADDLEDTGDEG